MKAFEDARLTSLLNFAYGDEADSGFFLSLTFGLGNTLYPPDDEEGFAPFPSPPGTLSPKVVERLRTQIREWLDALRDGEPVTLPRVAIELHPRRSNLMRWYHGKTLDVLLMAAGLLIADRWEDIGFCADPQCRRPFRKTGRREYHSDGCSQRVRTARYREGK